jgi:hypothetical protein
LTFIGQNQPSYEIKHTTGLFSSGPEFTLLSRTGANPGTIVGTVDWHSLTQKVKMKFPARNVEISYRALNGHFDAHNTLGRVEWKATGMHGYQATWQLSNAQGQLLSLVELHATGQTGTIEILRTDLPLEAFEEVLVSSWAQIEDLRRLMRNAKKSAVAAVVSAGGLAVGGLT